MTLIINNFHAFDVSYRYLTDAGLGVQFPTTVGCSREGKRTKEVELVLNCNASSALYYALGKQFIR